MGKLMVGGKIILEGWRRIANGYWCRKVIRRNDIDGVCAISINPEKNVNTETNPWLVTISTTKPRCIKMNNLICLSKKEALTLADFINDHLKKGV